MSTKTSDKGGGAKTAEEGSDVGGCCPYGFLDGSEVGCPLGDSYSVVKKVEANNTTSMSTSISSFCSPYHLYLYPQHAKAMVADLAGKIADSGKGKETICELALGAYTALANEAILAAEAYLVHHLPAVLNAAGHKNAKVR